MSRLRLWTVLVLPVMIFLGCGERATPESPTLFRVNDYQMSLKAFDADLAADLELDADYKLDKKGKMQFLEEMIRKEVLIQEAKKRKLDQKEKFMRAMERYWTSTLIRDLLDEQGREISKSVYVTQEEISRRYDQLLKADPNLAPLDKIQADIKAQLIEEKKSRRLDEWIQDLRRRADVEIDERLL